MAGTATKLDLDINDCLLHGPDKVGGSIIGSLVRTRTSTISGVRAKRELNPFPEAQEILKHARKARQARVLEWRLARARVCVCVCACAARPQKSVGVRLTATCLCHCCCCSAPTAHVPGCQGLQLELAHRPSLRVCSHAAVAGAQARAGKRHAVQRFARPVHTGRGVPAAPATVPGNTRAPGPGQGCRLTGYVAFCCFSNSA